MTGLVEKRAQRGYYVTEFSSEQVFDLYEFRKMLEINAVGLAIENAQPSHLQEFDRILAELEQLSTDPKDHGRSVKLDMELHELIARASGNHFLHQAMRNVLDKVTIFISMEISDRSALADAHTQHKALLHMIKEKDAEGARQLIRAHIDHAQENLVKVFQAREDLRNAVLATTSFNREGPAQP
jgi:DNA-binding GntR family transcriptional regulator